jgi:hypothetical protein
VEQQHKQLRYRASGSAVFLVLWRTWRSLDAKV